tara:strand:+ start:345 stop:482 length:138 start_codon:yes stop_codon:yes gene_type:complete
MIEIKPLNSLAGLLDKLIQGRLWLKVIIGLLLEKKHLEQDAFLLP